MFLDPLVTFLCHLESKISQPKAIASAIYTLRKLLWFSSFILLISSQMALKLTYLWKTGLLSYWRTIITIWFD